MDVGGPGWVGVSVGPTSTLEWGWSCRVMWWVTVARKEAQAWWSRSTDKQRLGVSGHDV